MPFPALIAAGFTQLEDSSFFQDAPTSPSISYETQGGITVARRRFTRAPEELLVTGFSNMHDTLKVQFDNYFKAMGCDTPFSYVHPTTGVTWSVRFDKEYKTKYIGAGATYLWELSDINLRSV